MAKEQKKNPDGTQKEDSLKKKAEKTKTNSTKKDKGKKVSIKDLKDQLSSEKDRILRLSAEFENYKKRKQRELDEFKKFANETVFRQLLTLADNLERAILSARENLDEDGLLKGVQLTHKEMIKLFETFNVKPVEAENQAFDPNFHQAVNQEETDEFPDNTVITVLQKGYLLHDRLIRPAMVVVSKKAKKQTEKTKEN
ncbi:MAG: nucleotide exchange factor GrpE [Deltaproteobacteria bacterium]|nr:nucleotide exchange factor GrpE [Deltaproteobacteria bacterium]